MDYKELIEQLRSIYAIGNDNPDKDEADHCAGCSMCDVSADTIENLLAERDAALEELRGICWCCASGKPWEKAGPLSNLTACEHLSECGVLACGGRNSKCQHWQWRGPQKEGDGT